MVTIRLQKAGKRFNKDWIFKDLDYSFTMGEYYALIGNNGSGKSTLLQIISGYATLSKGTIDWGEYDTNNIFQQISLAAPYLELVEEFTTIEQCLFHDKFKPLRKDLSIEQVIEMIGLKSARNKQIRYFSSGMKQRLKLALAIFSECPILLLDEPCSNLDKEGYALYHELVQKYAKHKLIIVGSNDTQEYDFCTKHINLMDYKVVENNN
jgi:ABC-type multidrug transport system ATPase subunit